MGHTVRHYDSVRQNLVDLSIICGLHGVASDRLDCTVIFTAEQCSKLDETGVGVGVSVGVSPLSDISLSF